MLAFGISLNNIAYWLKLLSKDRLDENTNTVAFELCLSNVYLTAIKISCRITNYYSYLPQLVRWVQV